MRIYDGPERGWRCGYWNGSPVEIGVAGILTRVPQGEVYHYDDVHEYYVVLHGRARLLVEGQVVTLEAGTVVMVQPGERHRVAWVDPDIGRGASSSRSAPCRTAGYSCQSRVMHD